MKIKQKNIIIIFFSILISLLFLWLAFRQVDWADFWQNFKKANFWEIIPAVIIFLLAYVFRTVRWLRILSEGRKLPWQKAFNVLVASFAINNVLPLRAGEIARLYFAQKTLAISKSHALGSLIIERLTDGLALLTLALISILVLKPQGVPEQLINIAAIIFGIVLVLVFSAVYFQKPFLKLIKIISRGKESLNQLVESKLKSLLISFENFKSPSQFIPIFFLSLIVWLTECWTYLLIAQSINLEINFVAMMLVLAILNFGILIPSSPGYVGTFEYFAIIGLGIFGISHSKAASFAIILHIIQYIPITLYGGLTIGRMGLSFLNLKESTK